MAFLNKKGDVMQRFARFLLPSLFILLLYFFALPWLALQIDQKFSLIWRLPFWTEIIAIALILISVAVVLRYFWVRAYPSDRSPSVGTNRMHIVESVGTWLGGVGLACLLRSPTLLGIDGIIAIVIILCSRSSEDPTLFSRFAKIVLSRVNRIPRWIMVVLVVAGTAMAFPELTMDKQPPPGATEPAILVQVRCKPGTSYLWKADFDKHIRPAIEDVIAKGNAFTGLQVIQATLPWQPFDFILIYTGKSFASLDKPGVPPHFAALFQREGTARAMAVLNEMNSYEEQSTVTIVYVSKVR
jgi:protein-S-isoprenylcysteine O-methyltransferase Ste14